MGSQLALGVDLGWVSQLESRGFCWVDEKQQKIDPIQVSKEMGADSIRLRVFVNPPGEGYDAVKECCPKCYVITHLAGVDDTGWCMPFLDNFFKQGGKTDILGFSYYPYWYQSKSDKGILSACLKDYATKYQKPVMIVEVGGEDAVPPKYQDIFGDNGNIRNRRKKGR